MREKVHLHFDTSSHFKFFRVVLTGLLTDAKVLKNISEHFVRGYFSEYFT